MLPQRTGNYGSNSTHIDPDAVYKRRQRYRMNTVGILGCLFVPWLTFCFVFATTSFKLHYSRPFWCWVIVALFGVLTLPCLGNIYRAIKAKMRHDEGYEPSWVIFLFVTMVIAIVVGTILGNINYNSFMQRYFDYKNLNDYNYVNPSTMQGVQMMDAGRLKFLEGAVLDLRKAMGFKNLNTYCVAPITVTNKDNVRAELANYDFWAVGLNCCSNDMTDFHCGEYNNPRARGGLRLLEDEERAFYRLAVQQAESVYHIKANHPLFLYWTQDPAQEMESWREEGYKWFFLAMLVHFSWQMLAVGLALAGFSKLR